jgi:hypothetical protein
MREFKIDGEGEVMHSVERNGSLSASKRYKKKGGEEQFQQCGIHEQWGKY